MDAQIERFLVGIDKLFMAAKRWYQDQIALASRIPPTFFRDSPKTSLSLTKDQAYDRVRHTAHLITKFKSVAANDGIEGMQSLAADLSPHELSLLTNELEAQGAGWISAWLQLSVSSNNESNSDQTPPR